MAPRATPLERLRALEQLGPRRLTGTPTEKAAQEALGAELQPLGFTLEWRSFRFTQSIYAGLMAHFALAVLGTALALRWPLVGLVLHGFVALSYTLESTRKALLLRGLFPSITSQNLIATLPARAPRRLRLALVAHADAAFTGLLFTPELIRLATKEPPRGLGYLKKQLGVAVASVALLAGLDVLALTGAWAAPWWLFALGTIPAFMSFVLNLDVVLRDRVVPGAADNLSGCTACVELAHRLHDSLPADVELVIVFTGAEEAGTGGALRLAQQLSREGAWDRQDTLVLGLDTLTNGTLRYLEEGEIFPVPVPGSLERAILATCEETRQAVTKYVIPSGATDALPFLAHGWEAVSLTCIDPDLGAPRHYHHPTDTWSNVDVAQLEASIDFAERLTRRLAAPPAVAQPPRAPPSQPAAPSRRACGSAGRPWTRGVTAPA